jgi:hypothetical protein
MAHWSLRMMPLGFKDIEDDAFRSLGYGDLKLVVVFHLWSMPVT